jgi:hypothetical protein
MKKFVIEMPEVAACDVTRCAYNCEGQCHAKAITVGDGLHPGCDTYLSTLHHTHEPKSAGVGACKVEACRHNRDVEHEGAGARCGTYDPR